MYKRLELHNHTNESDASCTCRELTELMAADQVDAFALTDHNTISGHKKIQAILEETHLPYPLFRAWNIQPTMGTFSA
uniref:PHP domain-containing protein n=1 Tax=Clostridium sp. NkU-1 TaxID=1095009 RepID=UPI0006D1E203